VVYRQGNQFDSLLTPVQFAGVEMRGDVAWVEEIALLGSLR
jgi:hypothetical protein